MRFDLSSLLIGIIAMDIIACIEVIIFVMIIKKRMGFRMRPRKIKVKKPVVLAIVVIKKPQEAYNQCEPAKKTVYRDANGRFCKKEDAVITQTVETRC